METIQTYNPFKEYGITTYEQFKKYPFLIFGAINNINKNLEEQVKHIQNNYFFGDRLILLGERGIGKTSTLFFIKNLLESNGVDVRIFSRLIEDKDHYDRLVSFAEGIEGKYYSDDIQKPIYILVDFPDTIEQKSYKRFLEFLWSILTDKNQDKINLIFAMNKSHYDKSFPHSEIFGKFTTLSLERLNFEETKEIITSRLRIIERKVGDTFEDETIELIYAYSKGIPRNVISACSLLFPHLDGEPINKNFAESILKEEFIEKVINDRVEDPILKKIYKQMADILQNNFNGTANSREDFTKQVMELTNLGRNSTIIMTKDLIKYGIFTEYRGGSNRTNKILSFN